MVSAVLSNFVTCLADVSKSDKGIACYGEWENIGETKSSHHLESCISSAAHLRQKGKFYRDGSDVFTVWLLLNRLVGWEFQNMNPDKVEILYRSWKGRSANWTYRT